MGYGVLLLLLPNAESNADVVLLLFESPQGSNGSFAGFGCVSTGLLSKLLEKLVGKNWPEKTDWKKLAGKNGLEKTDQKKRTGKDWPEKRT